MAGVFVFVICVYAGVIQSIRGQSIGSINLKGMAGLNDVELLTRTKPVCQNQLYSTNSIVSPHSLASASTISSLINSNLLANYGTETKVPKAYYSNALSSNVFPATMAESIVPINSFVQNSNLPVAGVPQSISYPATTRTVMPGALASLIPNIATVVPDNSVSNNLANALQLLVVSNLLGNKLPVNGLAEVMVPVNINGIGTPVKNQILGNNLSSRGGLVNLF